MKMKMAFIVFALVTIALFVYNRDQISRFRTEVVNIQSTKVRGDIRIIHITDFHSNHRIDLDQLTKDMEAYNPHMIAMTGDLVDQNTTDLTVAMDLMDSLTSLGVPVYFVEGNHEIANVQRKKILSELEKRNVTILDNQKRELFLEGQKVDIYGASFYVEEQDYKLMLEDIDTGRLNILLSHSPVRAAWYADGQVDLILSGHTHGGQVRLPFVGGLVSPGQGLFPELDKGHMKLPQGTDLYIDSGLGNSLLPLRIHNPVQYSQVTLENK